MGQCIQVVTGDSNISLKSSSKMIKNTFFILLIAAGYLANEAEVKEEKEEMLDGAESQNYGYGYGTKVDTPHGSSTVYVRGFGTDDSYHDSYNGQQAYGYGHIDPYLNHKQGYGYTKPGYGYNSLYGAAPHHGVGHHLGVAHHTAPHHGLVGVPHLAAGHHGVLGHHGVVGHHAGYAAHGAGYGAPQPFVGSGFRYGHGYGYGYGHISGHH